MKIDLTLSLSYSPKVVSSDKTNRIAELFNQRKVCSELIRFGSLIYTDQLILFMKMSGV
jgi:hypothetical protein